MGERNEKNHSKWKNVSGGIAMEVKGMEDIWNQLQRKVI